MAKVTLAEAAQLFGVSERTLLRRIEAQEVKAQKRVMDGHEHWIIEVDNDMPRHAPVMTPDMAAVMVVKDAEIADLKQEIALLGAKYDAEIDVLKGELAARDKEIADLNERLHEANTLVLRGQQRQLSGPKKWWQFWERT
jgi:predicted DNA-binding transcriptional regulator YafY